MARALLRREQARPQIRGDPRDRTRGLTQAAHELVGISGADEPGHRVLFLERELIGLAVGDPVQRDAGIEQAVARGREALLIAGLEVAAVDERAHAPGPARLGVRARFERPSHPAGRLHVTEPAGAVLQIGGEHLRDRARSLRPRARGGRQLLDEAATAPGHEAPDLDLELVDERAVTDDEAHVEQRGHRVEIGVGEVERLLHRAHGVPEHEPAVPQRVPEAAGIVGRRPRPATATRVQEHHVDVGSGAQLAPRVRPQRDERPRSGIEQGRRGPHELAVDQRSERAPERRAPERRVVDERLPLGAQAHAPARSHARAGATARRCPPHRCGCARRSRPGPPTPCRHRSAPCGRSR